MVLMGVSFVERMSDLGSEGIGADLNYATY